MKLFPGALALFLGAALCFIGQAAEPEWIWATHAAPLHSPVKNAAFRRAFQLNSVSRASIEVACDNRYQLYINGQHVGGGDNWQVLQRYEIAALLKPGANVIAIEATNSSNVRVIRVAADYEGVGFCQRCRGASWPLPGRPITLPPSKTTSPRRIVTTGHPVTSHPERIENLALESWSSSRIVRLRLGSQMTISASDPTPIVPLRG